MPNISFDIRDSYNGPDRSPEVRIEMREMLMRYGIEFEVMDNETCINLGRFRITCENGVINFWHLDENGDSIDYLTMAKLPVPAR